MTSPASPAPSSSALCTACGACCNGTLFDEVPLERAEIALGQRLRLPIVESGDAASMSLPCPRLDVATCTIYLERPSTCRSYKCGLLEELERGEVEPAEAHRRVDALRLAAAAVRDLLPSAHRAPILRAFHAFADEVGGRRSAAFIEGHAELARRVEELGVRTRAVTRGAAGEPR